MGIFDFLKKNKFEPQEWNLTGSEKDKRILGIDPKTGSTLLFKPDMNTSEASNKIEESRKKFGVE